MPKYARQTSESFGWRNVIERAVWTALQAPAVVAAIDAFQGEGVVGGDLAIAAGLGFAISAIKTIAQARLKYLRERGPIGDA